LHEVATGQYTVFTVVNGKPKVRAVEIGLMDSVNAEVKSGLAEGDVVTTGILVTK
jgi:multidrug efflux pump subunit AcrA (membrane-fusion protein)